MPCKDKDSKNCGIPLSISVSATIAVILDDAVSTALLSRKNKLFVSASCWFILIVVRKNRFRLLLKHSSQSDDVHME